MKIGRHWVDHGSDEESSWVDNTEVFLQETVLPVTLQNGRKYVFNTGGTATAFEKIQPHLLLEHPLPPRRMASGVLGENMEEGALSNEDKDMSFDIVYNMDKLNRCI